MNPQEKANIEKPTKELSREIERKFLVKQIPDNLDQYQHDDIKQGYIHVGADGKEFRLRQKSDKYYTTFKEGEGVARLEDESEIDKDKFETMWSLTEGRRLEKTRYYIPSDEHTIELDIYKGANQNLIIAEVEFNTEDEAKSFIPPEWIGDDVTGDDRYKNQNLALSIENKSSTQEKPYSLEDGLKKLGQMVKDKMVENDGTIIVEIAGGSASGKTSAVSVKLKEMFGDSAMIFSMDDYYRGRTYMAEEATKGNILNFDQPEVLNMPLLQEHIRQLKSGKSIQKPIYSFKEGETVGTEELKPKRIIIVEGLFALNDIIKDEGDIKAFVDIGTHGRILRRLLRDVERTGQKPEDILNYFSEIVEPMHNKYVQSTAKNADIIISNEYNPEIEADRSNNEEVQIKFVLAENSIVSLSEDLRKAGAEMISTTKQKDIYYNPKDRDLSLTDESLRIREEGERKILTYKGPKKDGDFRQRPKFEFEIDADTENKFLGIYGNSVRVLEKRRSVYQLDGVIFTVDNVKDVTDDKDKYIGLFIEIRSQSADSSDDKIRGLLNKLGLRFEDGIKKSYLEM